MSIACYVLMRLDVWGAGTRGRREKHPIGSHKWNKYWVIV